MAGPTEQARFGPRHLSAFEDAGDFIQEGEGEDLARRVNEFVAAIAVASR